MTFEATARSIADAVRPVAPEKALTDADVVVINNLARLFVARQSVGAKKHVLTYPSAFFAHVRAMKLFGASLDQGEVDGCNAILSACGEAGLCLADTAYTLATAFHETAGTMQPIDEYGSDAYFFRMYDKAGARPTVAARLGNTERGDGVRFHGRGYVQITGRRNYAKATAKLGVDLVANPDLAKQPDIAARVMIAGMREGWFTGRDLDDDLPRVGPATVKQFIDSRDIINGTDRASKIADEAKDLQDALTKGRWEIAA